MRLSWPKDGDRKRSIVLHNAAARMMVRGQGLGDRFLINTTVQDIELYHRLSLRMQPSPPTPINPDKGLQSLVPVDYKDLVNYCELKYLPLSPESIIACTMLIGFIVYDLGYFSLVTFGDTTLDIRNIIMSMAIAQPKDIGSALLHALLAFSSLRRHGPCRQALQLKISALHSLSASVGKHPLVEAEALQHIAASMLLLSYEVGRHPLLHIS